MVFRFVLAFFCTIVSSMAEAPADRKCTDGPAIYLLEEFHEGAKKLLHWKYNGGLTEWTSVEVSDPDGRVLAKIPRPGDSFDLSRLPESTKLLLTPVAGNGSRGISIAFTTGTASPSPSLRAFGRIGIRPAGDFAEFFNLATGRTFHPRGCNYVPLRGDHSLFQAATGDTTSDYDPLDAESMLRLLGDSGYNTVRIFLAGRNRKNPGLAGELDTEGLYTPYLDNLADFLSRAASHGIYVIINFCDRNLPLNRYFNKRSDKAAGTNQAVLASKGVEAQMEQLVSTLTYLKQKNPALLQVLLAVEFNNEVSLKLTRWPFDQQSPVTLANGKTYDMRREEDRLRAFEEGLLFYWTVLHDAVKKVDPHLLTCEGAFTAYAVGRDLRHPEAFVPDKVAPGYEWDLELGSRCPPSMLLFARSPLDFIDLHVYLRCPPDENAVEASSALESVDFQKAAAEGLLAKKPLVLGEFGSHKPKGSRAMDKTFSEACQRYEATRRFFCHEAHFTGWLLWAFDTFEQTNIHQVMADGGAFLRTFATFPPWPDHQRDATLHPEYLVPLPLELKNVPPTGQNQGFLIRQSLPPS